MTQTKCGQSCVDLASDKNHCGMCGNACGGVNVATSGCVGGACKILGCFRTQNGTMTVFVNTQKDTATRLVATGPGGRLFIGAESLNDGMTFVSRFKGAVDDVRFYERALRDAEVDAVRTAF
jgi:hypothetical protein